MSGRIAIKPQLYISTTCDDAATGRQLAVDAFMSQGQGKTTEQAAAGLVESLVELSFTDKPDVLLACLIGAVSELLELAGKPKVQP